MKQNTAINYPVKTAEGAPAARIKPLEQLNRLLMACMLWEKGFYADGKDIAEALRICVGNCEPADVAKAAIYARSQGNLRHAPLWIAAALANNDKAKGSNLVSNTIVNVIQRADELAEFLSLYWIDGRKRLTRQVKKGLAIAFTKFDTYQLAKWNNLNAAIKLRDVMFLVHPKPPSAEMAETYQRLADNELKRTDADTWETAIQGGKQNKTDEEKRAEWERLLTTEKLGYMALLRNLRNMVNCGVSEPLINKAILARKGARRVLPFRFVAAARVCPRFEPSLDYALIQSIKAMPELPGKTVVLVDVSGSMDWGKSLKGTITHMDAAAALASMLNAENLRVFSFSQQIKECPPRRGMAGIDAIINSQGHGGTYLGAAVKTIDAKVDYDRLIVITDEQSHDSVPPPKSRGYMINIAANRNGVGYGKWNHIDGFSESVIKYITAMEDQISRTA